MTQPIHPELALALALALERSQGDVSEALALLRQGNRGAPGGGAEQLLARAINRIEMMRMALGRRDDGPVLT